MGGRQIPGQGSGDDGFDEDGYDESQRAEIMEFERSGRTNGVIVTDLDPDLGEDEDLLADDDDDVPGAVAADLATTEDLGDGTEADDAG